MPPDPETVDWFERRRAVKSAKERGDVPFLIRALTNPDPYHRGLAAKALGELGATEAVPQLMRLLDASNPHVRIDGIQALGELGASVALPRLREVAAHDPDTLVRSWACSALAKLGDEAAVELTLPLLDDPSVAVRGSAAYTLGEVADPRALEAVRAARPHIFKSPVEWWVYHQTYRDAISAMKRRAAGKAPRPRTGTTRLRHTRELAKGAALVVVAGVVWFYAGFWWSFWLVIALALGWLGMMLLFMRKIPLDD
jgi:hypothetical protein